jgi:hypothetical protein
MSSFKPKEVSFRSLEDINKVLQIGDANRRTEETAANSQSSRSHSICQIKLSSGQVLAFIDLAGSERMDVTKVEGQRKKESIAINQSLSYLGDLIVALKDKNPAHVPWRNSKLNMMLQPFLGKAQAKLLLIVNLNPISIKEST